MSGLLLLLSMASGDAQAQSYAHASVNEYHHNAEEYAQILSLVQQWDDAVHYSPYGEHHIDSSLMAWIDREMAEDRAMIRGVRDRIEDLEGDIASLRREARYNNSSKLQRRISRKESRLSDARRDLAAMKSHRQQSRAIVEQLEHMQPAFDRGYATGHDYRTKRSLLWRLVDVTADEPMVTTSYSFSYTSSSVEISVGSGSPGYGSNTGGYPTTGSSCR